MELTKVELKNLVRLLDNALDNYELFTDVNDDNYETFDAEFHQIIKNIRNNLKGESNGNN
jgi:hypothetical protein